MANCPICGAKDMTCGGAAVHFPAPAKQLYRMEAMPVSATQNVWTAPNDFYLDEGGKVTTDRSKAVTLLVRGGQPLDFAEATRFGLMGQEPEGGVPSAAGLRLARQERMQRNLSGLEAGGAKAPAGVIPTGHPAFDKGAQPAQPPAGGSESSEEGEGAAGAFKVEFGTDESGGTEPPAEVAEREDKAQSEHNASEGAGAQPGQEGGEEEQAEQETEAKPARSSKK